MAFTVKPIKFTLRPAPDTPPLPPGTDPALVAHIESVRRWSRDAHEQIKVLIETVNRLQDAV